MILSTIQLERRNFGAKTWTKLVPPPGTKCRRSCILIKKPFNLWSLYLGTLRYKVLQSLVVQARARRSLARILIKFRGAILAYKKFTKYFSFQ